MLMWILELWKCSQLPTTNENYFWQLPLYFVLKFLACRIHFFNGSSSLN
jgi:hypothetical protein